jgi:hypothetical protein
MRDAAEKGPENDSLPVWPQGQQVETLALRESEQSKARTSPKNFHRGIVDAPQRLDAIDNVLRSHTHRLQRFPARAAP